MHRTFPGYWKHVPRLHKLTNEWLVTQNGKLGCQIWDCGHSQNVGGSSFPRNYEDCNVSSFCDNHQRGSGYKNKIWSQYTAALQTCTTTPIKLKERTLRKLTTGTYNSEFVTGLPVQADKGTSNYEFKQTQLGNWASGQILSRSRSSVQLDSGPCSCHSWNWS